MAESWTLRAHAKVNLALEVMGLRSDGYHDIDTVVQAVGLHDRVTVTLTPAAAAPYITVSGPCADGVPVDDRNLALRAVHALAALTGRPAGGVRLQIEKFIPAAGGLGGGSADAAAVLRGLQRLWGPIPDDVLVAAGAMVGSDEPAMVVGGTVRAQGRGERVAKLAPLLPHDVVLFVSPGSIERKTARMFAALDGLPPDTGSVAERVAAGRQPRWLAADVYNSFERVAFDLFPGLAALWEDLESRTGEAVRLAGAGPTLFWIGPAGAGARVAARARGAACTVVETETVGEPWTQ
ncbi:MAG: 4-(cytidine 5'-diphospho)-2-C-methyl-D-erythritol kinase [Dehalococcoidia bacterium]